MGEPLSRREAVELANALMRAWRADIQVAAASTSRMETAALKHYLDAQFDADDHVLNILAKLSQPQNRGKPQE
jgi:hypothetical protein